MNVDRDKILEILKAVYPFHRKEERLLHEVIDFCTLAEFHEGEIIYRQGAKAGAFYLVCSGSVELRRDAKAGDKPLVRLTPGDFLGFELFQPEDTYRATALATKDAVLLVFERDCLAEMIRRFPWLQRGLQTMLDSFRQASGVRLDWVGSDEVIYFISRRHSAFLFLRLIFPAVFSIAFVLLFLFMVYFSANPLLYGVIFGGAALLSLLACGWVYLDWTNDYSIITNQRVVFQEKVILLYDSRQEAPMNAVLKVDTATNLLGRWLGYGNVIASTYAGLVILQDLNHPEEAAAILLAASEKAHLKRRQVERKELDAMLRDRLNPAPFEERVPKLEEVPAQITPGKLQVLLANMFRMRFEAGPKITYRTHWFILFLKLLIPSLVLAGVFIAWLLQSVALIHLLPAGIFNVLVLLAGLAALAGWIYQYADWRNDFYEVTPDQVVDVYKKPLGREERQAAPLKNIQSIEFKRKGIIGLLLNFGTVFIRVGDFELTFDNVFNPAEVQRDLFQRIAERDFREKQTALAEEKERLADWIEAYHHYQQEARGDQNPAPPANN